MGLIKDFWNGSRYLFYGFSRNPKSIAREIYRKLTEAGLEFIPVRNDIDEIDGIRMTGDIASAGGDIDGALLIVSAKSSIQIMDELKERKINRVFFQIGAYNKEVIEKAKNEGFDFETGCALTRFDRMSFPHSTHRWMAKTFGGMK
jgi:predicted CoA-binding protein